MLKTAVFRTFPLLGRGKVLFLALLFAAGLLSLLAMTGCTEYERAGINARPFNEPRSWEINPYGNEAFQN